MFNEWEEPIFRTPCHAYTTNTPCHADTTNTLCHADTTNTPCQADTTNTCNIQDNAEQNTKAAYYKGILFTMF